MPTEYILVLPRRVTIADPPGKQKLKYRRVYSHHFHTTSIAESIHTTPNSIQCPFKCGYLGVRRTPIADKFLLVCRQLHSFNGLFEACGLVQTVKHSQTKLLRRFSPVSRMPNRHSLLLKYDLLICRKKNFCISQAMCQPLHTGSS